MTAAWPAAPIRAGVFRPHPGDVIERVPPDLRDQACVCERCASGRRSATEVRTIIDTLTRSR